ncbi:hypothetical protein [Alicyclobacillus fastidiosus]|uniref:Gram-positive cocci surface proteins LPxTG domain-containing protein n=1 Tax=Alicyclobacillus fastidiosus TaxID=392011 RepID=A0ABV5AGC6_9BACL|nr:hypothetical protein [Alicyclobacillus fastidiosus]WEH09566.1 hypothetical protein PYS47_23490 [Alicyclobacillus fastidiosus]
MKVTKIATGSSAALVATVILCSTAYAAGAGYAPGQSFGTSQTGGGTLSIVAAQTVSASGGTIAATAGSATLSVKVPSGAFSAGTQIVLAKGQAQSISGTPSGSKAVDDLVVSFLDSSNDGVNPSKPVTLTIRDSVIDSNAVVYKATSQGLHKVRFTAKKGEVDVTFTTDPEFVVVEPTSPVVDATQPVTGLPFTKTLAAGGLLALIGGLLLFSRRKAK